MISLKNIFLNKYVLFFLAYLFSYNNIISAQQDFREGYIIDNNNDTIYGFIEYKGNLANSKACNFKKEEHSDLIIYKPEDIKVYRFIEGKYYLSRNVEGEQLFLEFLINGIVDIFYYRDISKEHYLVEKEYGRLTLLEDPDKQIIKDGKAYWVESKEYIGVLKYIFGDSPSTSKKVEDLYLNHKSLINIAHDYHNEVCYGEECIIYEKKTVNSKPSFGISVGFNKTNYKISENVHEDFYYLSGQKIDIETFPIIGLYTKQCLAFINEKLFVQYNLAFTKVDIHFDDSYLAPLYSITYNNIFSSSQLSLNHYISLQYEFFGRKIHPIIQLGGFIKNYFLLDYSRNLDIYYSWGDIRGSYTFTEDYPFESLEVGYNIGFGFLINILKQKELSLNLNYQKGIGQFNEKLISNIISLDIKIELF